MISFFHLSNWFWRWPWMENTTENTTETGWLVELVEVWMRFKKKSLATPWQQRMIHSLKLTWHLKITPGKGDSYWKPSFLGAMLVLGNVRFGCFNVTTLEVKFHHGFVGWWATSFTHFFWVVRGKIIIQKEKKHFEIWGRWNHSVFELLYCLLGIGILILGDCMDS